MAKKTNLKVAVPGTAYKDGKFYYFSSHIIMVLTEYPDIRCYVKTTQNPSFHCIRPVIRFNDSTIMVSKRRDPHVHIRLWLMDRPIIRLTTSLSKFYQRKLNHMNSWFQAIPEDFSNYISKHFPTRHYSILSLLSRVPDAMDIRDNPALLFILANPWLFKSKVSSSRAIATARRLVRRKRRDICKYFNFPPRQDTVSILKKMVPGPNMFAFHDIRQILSENDRRKMKYLYHLPRINRTVLQLLSDDRFRDYVTSSLLEEVSQKSIDDYYAPVVNELRDCLHMLSEITPRGIPLPEIPIRDHIHLRTIHDEISERHAERVTYTGTFPDPPLEVYRGEFRDLDLEVKPLTSPGELRDFARSTMHNCAYSYSDQIRRGRLYIYSCTLGVEVACLSIYYHYGKEKWSFDQLLGIRNTSVSKTMRDAVHRWLKTTDITNHPSSSNEIEAWEPICEPLFAPDDFLNIQEEEDGTPF